jgi:hypothetical protein
MTAFNALWETARAFGSSPGKDTKYRVEHRAGLEVRDELPGVQLLLHFLDMARRRHERGEEAEALAGLDVEGPVPDEGARAKVDGEVPLGPLEELGSRFTAGATVLGGVRTVIERIDLGPVALEQLVEPSMNAFDVRHRVQSPRDPGLVSDADNELAVGVNEAQGISDAPEQLQAFRFFEVMKVGVERSVAVHEESPTDVPSPRRRL